MSSTPCDDFLRWALPELRMQWPPFRRVRRQVCRRITARMAALDLRSFAEYRAYLEQHEEEWERLDDYFRITISRMYRDAPVFDAIRQWLPGAAERSSKPLRIWSAGAASGEEPYTLAILCRETLPADQANEAQIYASEADPHLIKRARRARYAEETLKELPTEWRQNAFVRRADGDEPYQLHESYRQMVVFRNEDIRYSMPPGPFNLVLCRYVLMYFDEQLQLQLLSRISECIKPGGLLVLGKRDPEPIDDLPLKPIDRALRIYRRMATAGPRTPEVWPD